LVRACIALCIDYLDIADSRASVAGIAAFDAQAKTNGVFVLSGLSSFPALSFAALYAIAPRLQRIDDVFAGIAPSPHAGIGLNVISAVTSYAGKPVPVIRGGRPATGYGLIDSMDMVIAPPGGVPLRSRAFLLVDTPDLALLPFQLRHLSSIFTGAGTEPALLQHPLHLAALLVRAGVLRSLQPLAPILHRASRALAFGEHRGGMFVCVRGLNHQGRPVECSWHLTAEEDDGPFVPVFGVEALIRKMSSGDRPEPGARAATGELTLADFEAGFKRFAIASGMREARLHGNDLPLYRRILDTAWERLPPAIAAMHDLDGSSTATGQAEIERGPGIFARLVAAIVGFPQAARETDVQVRFSRDGADERWTRTFGKKTFSSRQSSGCGKDAYLLAEDFGPFRILMAPVPEGDRLRLLVRGWRFLGMPLPLFLAPDGNTYEEERGGRFHFHVEVKAPLIGLIVRYRGWLIRQEGAEHQPPAMPKSSASSAFR
jgi:hypothetical protein